MIRRLQKGAKIPAADWNEVVDFVNAEKRRTLIDPMQKQSNPQAFGTVLVFNNLTVPIYKGYAVILGGVYNASVFGGDAPVFSVASDYASGAGDRTWGIAKTPITPGSIGWVAISGIVLAELIPSGFSGDYAMPSTRLFGAIEQVPSGNCKIYATETQMSTSGRFKAVLSLDSASASSVENRTVLVWNCSNVAVKKNDAVILGSVSNVSAFEGQPPVFRIADDYIYAQGVGNRTWGIAKNQIAPDDIGLVTIAGFVCADIPLPGEAMYVTPSKTVKGELELASSSNCKVMGSDYEAVNGKVKAILLLSGSGSSNSTDEWGYFSMQFTLQGSTPIWKCCDSANPDSIVAGYVCVGAERIAVPVKTFYNPQEGGVFVVVSLQENVPNENTGMSYSYTAIITSKMSNSGGGVKSARIGRFVKSGNIMKYYRESDLKIVGYV